MNIEKPKIAMVASVGIGDACIYLIIANNLSINGFDVTFYSNPISQLQAWLPRIQVKPYPKRENCDKEFEKFDLVIADAISIVGKPYAKSKDFYNLSRKYVFLGVGFVDHGLRYDHTGIIKEKLSKEKFEKCRYLAKCSGEIRFQGGDRAKTQVNCAVEFCQNVLKLLKIERSSGFSPPTGFIKNKYTKRVMLHPFSSTEEKNWPLIKFIKLAKVLKRNGWQVAFTVSSEERSVLLEYLNPKEFQVPVFESLSECAGYIYESSYLIGNDSGIVNLSSAIGIPIVTILPKGKNHRWRPDWSYGEVVTPVIKLKLLSKKRLWKPFITVNMILKRFNKLVNKGKCPNESHF